MRAAMEAVSGGKINTNAADKSFGVPRKTLDDRIKGKVRHGTKLRVTTVLSMAKEESLANYLVYMAERGFPLTRTNGKGFRMGNCKAYWQE